MRRMDEDIVTVIKALERALKTLPGANVTRIRVRVPARRQYAPTAAFEMTFGPSRSTLFVQVENFVGPREVEAMLGNLLEYAETHDSQAVLFAGRRISKLARRSLENGRGGYFDLDGSLHLNAPPVYVRIDRATAPAPEAEDLHLDSLLQPHRGRIVDHMLNTWPLWLGVDGIAEQIGGTPSVISRTLNLMGKLGWLETEGSGPRKLRRLSDRSAVIEQLSAYGAHLGPLPIRKFWIDARDSQELVTRFARLCTKHQARYALSGAPAAQILTGGPVDTSPVLCRIEGGWKFSEIMRELAARPVRGVWNFGIIEAKGAQAIETGERINHVQLASPYRIWCDLARPSLQADDNGKNQALAKRLAASRYGQ